MTVKEQSQQNKEIPALTKSELVSMLSKELSQLSEQDVELAVNTILDSMGDALCDGDRIEIRGFGSLSLHYRPARIARNPKTGDKVQVPEKYVPHFKTSIGLRKRVNSAPKRG